jgi:hypothetical protein
MFHLKTILSQVLYKVKIFVFIKWSPSGRLSGQNCGDVEFLVAELVAFHQLVNA